MKRKPAPPGRLYQGWREGGTAGPGRVVVRESWGCRKLDPRFDLWNHSPDGFQWGYGGSGPAQLALALVADATGDDELARRTYQQFKFEIVANLAANWSLDAATVQLTAARIAVEREVTEP